MKKILFCAVLAITVIFLCVFQVKAKPENAKDIEEILDSAFLIAQQNDYLYHDMYYFILREIPSMYLRIGSATKSIQTDRIIDEKFAGRIIEKYDFGVDFCEKEWIKVRDRIDNGELEEVLRGNQDNPCVLSRIARIYIERMQPEKAKELLKIAYEKTMKDYNDKKPRNSEQRDIAYGYTKIGEYDSSFNIINNLQGEQYEKDAAFRGMIVVLLKRKLFDRAFKVAGNIKDPGYRLSVLVDIASGCLDSEVKLDDEKRKILKVMTKNK